MKPPSSANRGFTLVEMVVVCAIIMLLLTFAVPSWARARYRAKCVECVNAKKQMFFGFIGHATDNAGSYPNWKRGWDMQQPGDIEWFMLATLFRNYGVLPEWSMCTFATVEAKASVRSAVETRLAADPGFTSSNPKWILSTTTYWVKRGYHRPANTWAGVTDKVNPPYHITSDRVSLQRGTDAIYTDVLTDKSWGADTRPENMSSYHTFRNRVDEIAVVYASGSAVLVRTIDEAKVRFTWWHPPFLW